MYVSVGEKEIRGRCKKMHLKITEPRMSKDLVDAGTLLRVALQHKG